MALSRVSGTGSMTLESTRHLDKSEKEIAAKYWEVRYRRSAIIWTRNAVDKT